MKRILLAALAAVFAISSLAATTVPVSLLSPVGSTAGQVIASTGSATPPAWTTVTLSGLSGTVAVANGGTGSTTAAGARTALGVAASGANTDVTSLNGPNIGSATATTVGSGTNSTAVATTAFVRSLLASPAPIGNTAANTGAFTTLTATTAAAGTSTTQVATTAFATGALATYAGIAGQPYFQAVLSANQSFTASATPVKIAFNTKVFDSNTYYDSATNYRFTPLKAGKYRVTLHAQANATGGGQNILWLYKNGAAYSQNNLNLSGSPIGASTQEINIIVNFNGTTDYVEGYMTIVSGTSVSVAGGGPSYPSYFEAYYIGP